ncbi:MAG: hypothetical protein Q4G39_09745 [Brachymonas sp.]|nr:hypothetical protein [Brachymonas sp.]
MPTPCFINLDLELSAPFALDALADYFGTHSFLLFNGAVDDGYRLAAEPLVGGSLSQDAIGCTQHFLDLIKTMPADLRDSWNACSSRVFDYGFDAGHDAPPLQTTLPAQLLFEMAQLGIDMRATIYPKQSESTQCPANKL